MKKSCCLELSFPILTCLQEEKRRHGLFEEILLAVWFVAMLVALIDHMVDPIFDSR